MSINRREAVYGAASLALAPLLWPAAARAEVVDLVELMKPSPLGDIPMGAADAPVTIVEYSSMTCNHCAGYKLKTFPKIKERYIDTGKVRYILREFPLDPLAAGASMLTRCAGNDKYYPMIVSLYEQYDKWVVQKPLPALFAIAKQAGFTQESFDKCLSNQELLNGLEEVRKRGAEKFNVRSTPTFFINGERLVGAQPLAEFEQRIEKYLKA